MIKNNFLKITTCMILASAISMFCSQAPKNFTAESLIRYDASMGQIICFNGQQHEVVETKYGRSQHSIEMGGQNVSADLTSREVTMCRPIWGHMRVEETTVSGELKTIANLKNNESKNCDKPVKVTKKTYFSTLAKVLGSTAFLGVGVAAILKYKNSNSR